MKKISYIIVALICFCLVNISVKAAPDAVLSVSSKTIEVGKNVTVYVNFKGVSTYKVQLSASGATYGCSFGDNGVGVTDNAKDQNFTIKTTCKASSVGIIGLRVSGIVYSSDEKSKNISMETRVNVVEPRKASTNNALKSLSVEGYELTPAFDSEVLEYSVSVPSTVNSVKINGAKQDNYASVEGLGEKEVIEGANKFEVVVTAESGTTRTYSVIVNVVDDNPITIKDGLTVVKNSKYVEIPEGYVEEKTLVNGVEVPAFKNEFLNIVLIAVRDSQGNNYFYEVKDGDYIKFVNLNGVNLVLYPQDNEINIKGYEKTAINIGGNEITAYKYKGLDNYYLVYARDLTTNEEHIYMYDFKNNTYQIFNEDLFNELVKDRETYMYFACGSLGVIFLCIIIIISLSRNRNKRVKKNNKNDEVKEELIKEVEEEIKENKKKKKNKIEDIDL